MRLFLGLESRNPGKAEVSKSQRTEGVISNQLRKWADAMLVLYIELCCLVKHNVCKFV